MLYFKNNQVKEKLLAFMDEPIEQSNIYSIMTAAEKAGISFGYLQNNPEGEIQLALNQDYVYINAMGEIETGIGKYAKFLDLNSSVTDLETTMCRDITDILNRDVDVLQLGN